MKENHSEAMERLQKSIDCIEKRMRIDSNDLDYETHLRQKRKLQQFLDRGCPEHGNSCIAEVWNAFEYGGCGKVAACV